MKEILNGSFFVFILVLMVAEVWNLECYQCNSKDTKECATNPGLELTVGYCDASDYCVVTIIDGETHRGCLSEVIPSKLCYNLCYKCNRPLCNGVDFPLDRRRCYQCTGSDCSDVYKNKIDPTPCRIYNKTDSCYTEFVDNENIVRGCLTDGEITCNNYCNKCNFDACNKEIGLLKHYCYECNKDEASCKRPQENMEVCKVTGLKTCINNVLPGNKGKCFIQYNLESNELTRGCSPNLTPGIVGNLTECSGDFCNNECWDIKCIICDSSKDWKCQNQTEDISTEICPEKTTSCYACENLAWTLECYQCNSKDTKECSTKPGKHLTVDQCEDTETCIVAIIEDNTYRGCLSKVFPSKVCSDICYQCNTTLCNDIDYPSDRRHCYQCSGSSCIDVKKNNIQPAPCRKYSVDDLCYTDFVGIHNTVRGCESDGDVSCNTYCRKCDYNGCNDEIGLNYQYCYECSYIKSIPSMSDSACKRPHEVSDVCLVDGIKNCTNKVIPGNKANCFTHYVPLTDVVTRGCSQTQGLTVGGLLTECNDDFCNDQCIDIKCIVCDSIKDYKCKNNTKNANPKDCPPMTMSCYTCEDIDGHVTRGCGVSPNKWPHCTQCYDDDGCNRKSARTCYSCTSTEDRNCADWTNPSQIPKERCENPEDECVATALPYSYTKRGCLANVSECTNGDPNCKRCKSSLCNDGVVPPLRQFCHQCIGLEHQPCTNEQHPALSKACPTYAPTDSCFMYLNDDEELIRGCSTDAAFKECTKNPEKCMICKDNGCNSWPKYSKPSLACIKCSESEKSCAWGKESGISIPCERQVPFFSNESCFIYEHSSEIVSRGCTLDNPNNPLESGRTYICTTPGCNGQNKVFQYCIKCDSKIKGQESCATDNLDTSADLCIDGSLQLFENRGCYTKRMQDGSVVRGCSFDLNLAELNNCRNNSNSCEFCLGQACNNLKAPSQGNRLVQSLQVILAINVLLAAFII